ncbi:Altered inheritance of mitochondria protein 9, mitochondrial [Tolypocladium ophioglossoides CBS 100239]|uniref:Altered inheritance of mitochondria protein 9, mitochondrial n=1 Tax=Tolypocladium ophioglossoides (strain CBS 100239) TaxID=1163406 RepID=A0A0L0N4P1_TOLOC|nr:Altered inheritance of mitochondria protein 9, mitochondrial [Tolypocladium ophioglossoides CBS 100239]
MTQPFRFRWTGQHWDEASENTFHATNWDALLDVTRRLSGDAKCVFDGVYHAGGRHIVRRIAVPSRQSKWIARIPIMPSPNPESEGSWWTSEQQFTMQSEIATMKYIAKTTNIPVPEVFGYNICVDANPVGLPYMLMHCIEGNMLYDLGGPCILNSEQSERVRKSIASIQCQLFGASLNQIGCLVLDSSGEVGIGHLPAAFGFQGPFNLPADYFSSWVGQNPKFKNLQHLNDLSLRHATESFPGRLGSVIHKLNANGLCGRYPVLHPDFFMHNILLNDEFEVVGVIDWEYAYSVPIGVFAARINMFARFDSVKATLDWDDEGAQYIADVERMEGNMDLAHKLCKAITSPVGILGVCMQLYEEGTAVPFDKVMDKIEREL